MQKKSIAVGNASFFTLIEDNHYYVDKTAAFKSLIESNGTVTNVNEWGKRRLAYPINDMHEGYYVLIEFESNPEFPHELDRIYNITDGIMRSLIVAQA